MLPRAVRSVLLRRRRFEKFTTTRIFPKLPPIPNFLPPMTRVRTKTILDDDETQAVYDFLLENSTDGKLKRGAVKRASELFGISLRTVGRIRARANACDDRAAVVKSLRKKYKGRSGRRKYDTRKLHEKVRACPIKLRGTFESLSAETGIGVGTLHRAVKRGDLSSESRRIKPKLTLENRIARVNWCLSHINMKHREFPFRSMYNRVHVDEKWFYIMQLNGRVITVPGEEIRKTSLKSKRFLTKVMFLSAVTVPRYDYHNKKWFDGRIGLWPFVQESKAKRNSKIRPKGAVVMVPVAVDKHLYRKFLIEKVFPAIRYRFPSGYGRYVEIQQDNAKPHSCWNDAVVQEEARRSGWKLKIINQPPNSPDLNVLDLGFFRSVQSLQQKKSARTITDLLIAVDQAFNDISSETLLKNFVTLKEVMKLVLSGNGSNQFKMPHAQKAKRMRAGESIEEVYCPHEVVHKAKLFLKCPEEE